MEIKILGKRPRKCRSDKNKRHVMQKLDKDTILKSKIYRINSLIYCTVKRILYKILL